MTVLTQLEDAYVITQDEADLAQSMAADMIQVMESSEFLSLPLLALSQILYAIATTYGIEKARLFEAIGQLYDQVGEAQITPERVQ